MTKGEKVRVRGLLEARHLTVRFSPGDPGARFPGEGLGKVVYAPDPKGGKILLPLHLKNTQYVEYYDGAKEFHCNVARFLIGGGYLVRVVWDRQMDCLRVLLPTTPGAEPSIIWYDVDEVYRDGQAADPRGGAEWMRRRGVMSARRSSP